MSIARVLGWGFLLLGIGILGWDVWSWSGGAPIAAIDAAFAGEAPPFHLMVFGEIWFAIDPESLQLIQPAIERHLVPWLWDPVLITILLLPASLTFIVLGLVVLLASRLRRRRPRFRPR
jgi:hypothetical protein